MEKTSEKRENFFRRIFKAVTGLKSRKAFAVPYILFMMAFVVMPLVIVVIRAFVRVDGGVTYFSFANFGKFLSDGDFYRSIWASIWMGGLNSVLCLLIGYPIAYFLSNAKYNKFTTAYMLFILPMWMNFLLRTVATKAVFNSLNIELGGAGPVMFCMVYNFLPFMIMPLYSVLSKMDKNLVEAAADLGANNRQVFTKAIIPLSMPGIVSGIIMVFMPTVSAYVIVDMVGGENGNLNILGNYINSFAESSIDNYKNIACAISIVMLIFIGATMLLSNKYDKLGDAKGEGLW